MITKLTPLRLPALALLVGLCACEEGEGRRATDVERTRVDSGTDAGNQPPLQRDAGEGENSFMKPCREACTAPSSAEPEDPCAAGRIDDVCLQECLELTRRMPAACAQCVVDSVRWVHGCNDWECGCTLSGPTRTGCDACPLPIGARCEDRPCGDEAVCETRFAGERSVCTRSCSDTASCPEGTECTMVPDLDGKQTGPFCMRPCQRQTSTCAVLGSECDAPLGATSAHCF